MSSNRDRWFPALDYLRVIAFLAVFFFHYTLTFHASVSSHLVPIALYGWLGVDLFFVLSGFLIGRQLFQARESDRVARFYLRRILRTWPAYFAVLAFYFLIYVRLVPSKEADLWPYLTFLQNFRSDFSEGAFFKEAWSLCVEEQFYGVPIRLAEHR